MSPDNHFWPDFAPDAPALFADLSDNIAWDETMCARKTASFGVPYNYAQMNYPAQDFPLQLANILPALEAKIGWMPNNCLVISIPMALRQWDFISMRPIFCRTRPAWPSFRWAMNAF